MPHGGGSSSSSCWLDASPACFSPTLPNHPTPNTQQVRFQESRISFLSFVTSLCAIIGGVFTGAFPAALPGPSLPASSQTLPGTRPRQKAPGHASRLRWAGWHAQDRGAGSAVVKRQRDGRHGPAQQGGPARGAQRPTPLPCCPARPAVSGIVDATVYHGQQAIKKKLDLGKLS